MVSAPGSASGAGGSTLRTQVVVLRGGAEGGDLLPADGQENPARCRAERGRGVGEVGRRGSSGRRAAPARAGGEREERHAGGAAAVRALAEMRSANGWVASIRRSKGVVARASREAFGAAEAADPEPAGLRRRVAGAAGERQGDGEAGAGGEPGGEVARLAGAAEDQDAAGAHADF